ncbi:MAG: hypothetical protein ACRC62_02190 [Microcoleus sp.]
MAIGEGVYYDLGKKEATTPVAVIRESVVRDFAVGDNFLTHNLVKTTDTVTIRGVAYPLAPLSFFSVEANKITGRPLALNESYRILVGNEYRLYKNIEGELVSYSTGNMMEGPVYTLDRQGRGVTSATPIADLEEGKKYFIPANIGGSSGSATTGASYTITEVVSGVKVVKELAEFQQVYNVQTATLQWFRGGILQDLSQPVPYSFMMLEKNINLFEADGITRRVIPRSEVVPFLPKEGGEAVAFFATATVNFTIVLNAQDNKRENLAYIFRETAPNSGFTWRLHPPFDVMNLSRPRAFDSCMPQRGDRTQGIVYRLLGYPSYKNPTTGAWQNRINWTPKADGTLLQWVKIDASEEARLVLEAKIEANSVAIAGLSGNKTGGTVRTTANVLNVLNGDEIIIDGAGAIQLPETPGDKFTFWINDQWNYRLDAGRNNVVQWEGQTIGAGQGLSTADSTTPFNWGPEDKGAVTKFVYDLATKNWEFFLSRQGVATTGLSQKPAIITGATTTIAQPYDRLRLGGNGDIDISALKSNGEFVTISWQPGETYTPKVLCPQGYTIGGVAEDFTIDTINTASSRVTLLLVGTDYGVSI